MNERLELLDWKRRVFALYESVRADPEPERAWTRRREVRDELFRTHAQTPLPEASSFSGLPYFAYNPSCSYDSHWVCPLAPPENRLTVAGAGGRAPLTTRPWIVCRSFVPKLSQSRN